MESLMQEALNRVRKQYGVDFKLSKSRPGSVLPKIELQSGDISFNPKLQSFLTLYNLMMQLENIDSECVTLFRLYNLYLDNDAYSLAEDTLRQLKHELDSFVRAELDGSPFMISAEEAAEDVRIGCELIRTVRKSIL